MIEAKWLFQNHKAHISRIQVLEYLLQQTKNSVVGDNAIIDMLTFRRNVAAVSHPGGGKSSRTEYIALHMDELRQENAQEISKIHAEWRGELSQLTLYVYLRDAAFNSLTEEERVLVQLHYENRYTIDEITQLPLTDMPAGLKSKSTLRRMLRAIEEKCQQIVNVASPSA